MLVKRFFNFNGTNQFFYHLIKQNERINYGHKKSLCQTTQRNNFSW